VRVGVRVTQRRADNCELFRRENTVAKGILTVALMKWVPFFHSHADGKMKRLIANNRRKFVGFWPNSVFMITYNHNSRFCTLREKILILLYRKDVHSRKSMGSPLFAERAILAKSDFVICVERLEATLFFLIAFQPNFLVRVQISKWL
jgi:hypothetical protein